MTYKPAWPPWSAAPAYTTLGGMMPVPAHPVQVELVASQTGDQLAGVGSASNLLGALSALAGVRGAQTGEVQGVVLHAELTQGQLQGSCWVNLRGTESEHLPCEIPVRSAPP